MTLCHHSNMHWGCIAMIVSQCHFLKFWEWLTNYLCESCIVQLFWNFKEITEIFMFYCIDSLSIVGASPLYLLYLLMKQPCYCIKYPFIEPCWTKVLHILSNCDASIFGFGLLITILGLVIFVPQLLILVLPWFLVEVLFTFVMILFVSIFATMFVPSITPMGLGNFIYISL